MTFICERVTPGAHVSYSRTAHRSGRQSWRVMLAESLPIELDVLDLPEARRDYPAKCACSQVYRLTEDQTRSLRRRGLLDQRRSAQPDPCVCACMGYLLT